ncbi:MAG TPA: transposase [Opitutus sp.]|nr:transposase [Opitutus sp.]
MHVRTESAAPDLPSRRRPAHFPANERQGLAVIYFVTVCTDQRRPVLANVAAHAALVEAWRAATRFNVGRYVVMPDHVHFFCAPATNPPEALARWVAFWKSAVARQWPKGEGGKLWQRDFWDVQLRRGQSYAEKWIYVCDNPVRAGLVKRVEEWPYQGELSVLRWHE